MVAPDPASQNGIGNYSARLTEELRLQDSSCSIMNPICSYHRGPCPENKDWRGREFPRHWAHSCLETIDATPPQLVHIQHGLYVGHGRDLACFLSGLRTRRIPCVMTLHGVWPPTVLRRWPVRFYRLLATNVERVIVHQRAATLELLQNQGIPAGRIAVIPHGTWTGAEVAAGEIPDTLNAKDRRIVLFAGNIFRRKGLHVVIRAFAEVIRKIPEACLMVVGDERCGNPVDRLYRLWLHARMRAGVKKGWLLRRPEYVSHAELATRIAAADVAVFPYLRRYGSASGVFHRVLAAGRPAICSRVPTFAEAVDAWSGSLPELFPPPGDARAWSRALIRVLSDESLRERATKAAIELGRETSWSLVALNHLRLYRSLLSPPPVPGGD